MIGIVVLFGQLLRLQEALAHLGEDLVSAAEEGVRSLGPGRPRLIRQDRRREAAIDHLERSSSLGGVEGCVVAVLRLGEPVHPSSMSITCNTAQVHGNHFIDHLRLAVSLRVESRAHAQLDADHLEVVTPDVASEHGISIADDGGQKSV